MSKTSPCIKSKSHWQLTLMKFSKRKKQTSRKSLTLRNLKSGTLQKKALNKQSSAVAEMNDRLSVNDA